MQSSESLIVSTAVALGIGLLVGTERERSKGSGPDREIAGVRTFALVGLLGVAAAVFDSTIAIAVFALLVGAITVAGYLRTRAADPGVTTEIALMVVFALGALSFSHPIYSAGTAVVVTLLLASRTWLHDVVQHRLSEREMHDVYLLAAAALIILPLLPNRPIDPWEIFNPYRVWVVVVLVMFVNALGYVALRVWGPTRGLPLAGFLGGLVSSAATHGAMAARSKQDAAQTRSAAAAASFSSVTTALFILTVVGTVDVDLTRSLAPAFVVAAVTSAAYGFALLMFTNARTEGEIDFGRPIHLRAALILGGTISGVLMISLLFSRWLGPHAALTSTAVAGFADAHSSSISAAMLARNQVLTAHDAQLAVLLGFSANALTKMSISVIAGSIRFAAWIVGGLAASVLSAWLVWLGTNS